MSGFEFNPNDYVAPHCNTEVLHAPGECEFCDKYPDRQNARIASKTPFSPVDQAWPGNRPEGYRDYYFPASPVAYHKSWDIELEHHETKTDGREWFWSLWTPEGKLARSGWATSDNRAMIAALTWEYVCRAKRVFRRG